jgi:hypothetical protein
MQAMLGTGPPLLIFMLSNYLAHGDGLCNHEVFIWLSSPEAGLSEYVCFSLLAYFLIE